MKIINRNYQSISTKTVRGLNGSFYLNIGCSFVFDLQNGSIDRDEHISPLKLFDQISQLYKYHPIFDEVNLKQVAEVMSLCTYTVNKTSNMQGFVGLAVGGIEKTLHIHQDAECTEIDGFIKLPIEPNNEKYLSSSFKSSFYTQNSMNAVNGYWPLAADSERRTIYLGQFDSIWLKNRWPHLPSETNDSYFQRCTSDQWLNGYITGGESIRLTNVSEVSQIIECKIPKCRPRIFVEKLIFDKKEFVELKANIDTLWLFPDAMKAVLTAHAQVLVNDPSASNILVLYADVDDFDNQLSIDQHYLNSGIPIPIDSTYNHQSVAIQDISNNQETLEVDLTQQDQIGIDHIDLKKPDLEKMQQKSDGFDTFVPSSLPMSDNDNFILEAIPEDFLNNMIENNIQANTLSLDQMKEAIKLNTKQLFSLLKKSGITEEQLLDSATELESLKDHANVLKSIPGGISGLLAEFESTLDSFSLDIQHTKLDEQVNDEPTENAYPNNDTVLNHEKITREYVVSNYRLGVIYDSLDFSGLDLSCLNLDGAVFVNCNLSNTNFANSTMTGVKFDSVCADEANFTYCNFGKSTIVSSSFVCSDLSSALINEANLKDVNLCKSRLNNSNLSKSIFSSCDISYAELKYVNAEHLIADKCNFSESDLANSVLNNGRFRKTIFYNANLTDCNFSLTNCSYADFSAATMLRTIFSESILCDTQASRSANFTNVKLNKSDISNSNWENSYFDGVNFDLSIIKDCDFSNSIIANTSMINVLAQGAVFDFAKISASNFTGINLLYGAFRGAVIKDSRFELSNLFAVDFQDAEIHNVSTEGSDLSRTILSYRR